MSERRREHEEEAAGADWLARVAEGWAPAPLDEAGRARFGARLAERIAAEERSTVVGWLAPLSSALVVVALAWWGFTGGPAPAPAVDAPRTAPRTAAWEWEVLLEDGTQDALSLPDEYSAIAVAFLP